jgi:hypothetical protein
VKAEGECSSLLVGLKRSVQQTNLHHLCLQNAQYVNFEKILILLKSSSCNYRLITQQFDVFVVSHELVCLLFPTINFHVSYQNLHVVMVTESAIVQKTEAMNLCFFVHLYLLSFVFFTNVLWSLLHLTTSLNCCSKSDNFTWCWKFLKLIGTKGQIFNNL